MTSPHHEAVKLAVSREFGVDNIQDPDELREFLDSKWATMDAAERTAFEIQLGRAATELEAGGPPRRTSYALAVLIFVTIAWFVWRPIAAISAIYAIAGPARRFSMRHALFWVPKAAVIVGILYGLVIAGLVLLANNRVFTSTVGHVLFGGFGLCAVLYIGYDVGGGSRLALGADKRRIAQGAAAATYTVALLAAFLARMMYR